jgi:hypothetical protein
MFSLAARLPIAAITLVVEMLAPLLMRAIQDKDAALQTALAMLADYRPVTQEELGLAAEVIAFRLQALGALSDSARPENEGRTKLDLLKAASALRRNETSAQRKLDALQKARRAEPKRATGASDHAPGPSDQAPETIPDAKPPSATNVHKFPTTPAEERALPDEALKAHLAAYSPGAKAMASAGGDFPAAPRPRSGGIEAFVQILAADMREIGEGKDDQALTDLFTEFGPDMLEAAMKADPGATAADVLAAD